MRDHPGAQDGGRHDAVGFDVMTSFLQRVIGHAAERIPEYGPRARITCALAFPQPCGLERPCAKHSAAVSVLHEALTAERARTDRSEEERRRRAVQAKLDDAMTAAQIACDEAAGWRSCARPSRRRSTGENLSCRSQRSAQEGG